MNGFERWFAKVQFGAKKRQEFYEQLIALVRAGMSRRQAIETAWVIASKDGKKPKEGVAMILADVKRRLENGLTFGEAMEPWAPADDVMVLNAIESSPDFATSLENYLNLDKRRRAMLGKVMGGMAYPSILLLGAYSLVIYFGKNVMPQLNEILPMEQWTGPAAALRGMAIFADRYVVPVTLFLIAAIAAIIFSLPRWAGAGRSFADKLPLYSIYRAYTGVNFLVAMAALTNGGVKVVDSINNIIPRSSPYVKKRLLMTRHGLLSGKNLGQALYDTGTDWPDPRINLNLKVFAQTQDLSASMERIAGDSLTQTEKKMDRSLAGMKFFAMMAVFLVLVSVMGGIFGLQSQLGQQASMG